MGVLRNIIHTRRKISYNLLQRCSSNYFRDQLGVKLKTCHVRSCTRSSSVFQSAGSHPMADKFSDEDVEVLSPAKIKWFRILRRLYHLQRGEVGAGVDGSSGSRHLSTSSDISNAEKPMSDDRTRINDLLQKIFSYRDTNVTSLVVEESIKVLCMAYAILNKEEKSKFLKNLSVKYSTNHEAVKEAAQALVKLEDGDEVRMLKAEDNIKNAVTPQYSWLFTHMGRLEQGVKFLVDLRTDILDLLNEMDVQNVDTVHMQRLNATLRDLLSLWFSSGFLDLERVTWDAPCRMLQKIAEYEAVHPVRSWKDLKIRVGPYRRCFVYTHSSMPKEPIMVLHTALTSDISSNMRSIVRVSRMSVDASSSYDITEEDPDDIQAAVFYSISSTQKGLQGIELGNYLIKRVVKELQAEFPKMDKFSSLSPIPKFTSWLLPKLKVNEEGTDCFTTSEVAKLCSLFESNTIEDMWKELKRSIQSNEWMKNKELSQTLEIPLMRLCARYLFVEKRRGYALDSVANFHLRNGAMMWRLNWNADTTPRGLSNSCGMMVNYRYFLDNCEANSKHYLENQHIQASDEILHLAKQSMEVMNQLSSKM